MEELYNQPALVIRLDGLASASQWLFVGIGVSIGLVHGVIIGLLLKRK